MKIKHLYIILKWRRNIYMVSLVTFWHLQKSGLLTLVKVYIGRTSEIKFRADKCLAFLSSFGWVHSWSTQLSSLSHPTTARAVASWTHLVPLKCRAYVVVDRPDSGGNLNENFYLYTNLSRCFVDDVWVGLGLPDDQLGKFANRLLVWIANVYRRGDVFQILLISKSLSHLLDCISPIKPSTRSSTYWNERVCEPLP